MTLPGSSISYIGGSSGGVSVNNTAALVMGPTIAGPQFTLTKVTSPSQVASTFTGGYAAQAAALLLGLSNGPKEVYVIAHSGSVAHVSSSVTTSGPTIQYKAGAANTYILGGDYDVLIDYPVAGGPGTAQFRYSLDGGSTYSPNITVPVGLTYTISPANIQLTFQNTTYGTSDYARFNITGSQWNTTDLTTADDLLTAANVRVRSIVHATSFTSTSQGTAYFAAVNTDMSARQSKAMNAPVYTFLGQGTQADQLQAHKEAFCSLGNKIAKSSGWAKMSMPITYAGYGVGKVPSVILAATLGENYRAVSDNAAWPTNALPGVTVQTDELLTGEVFSAPNVRGVGFMSLPGDQRIRMTQDWLATDTINDPTSHQMWGRIINLAEQVLYDTARTDVNTSFDTNADGTLTKDEIALKESKYTAALAAAIEQPTNERNGIGYVMPGSTQVRLNSAYDAKTNEGFQMTASFKFRGNSANIQIFTTVRK